MGIHSNVGLAIKKAALEKVSEELRNFLAGADGEYERDGGVLFVFYSITSFDDDLGNWTDNPWDLRKEVSVKLKFR